MDKKLPGGFSLFKKNGKDERYEHEDVDDKIEQTQCENEYNILLTCLDRYDRNWGKCQNELKTFSKCYKEKKKETEEKKK